MFTDEINLRAGSACPYVALSRVQNHLDIIYSFFQKWKKRVNVNKTEFMLFSRRKHRLNDASLLYGEEQIRRVQYMKLLGLNLDGRLNYGTHAMKTLNKAMYTLRTLFPLLVYK